MFKNEDPYIQELETRIDTLRMERCDCVVSIRASSQCWCCLEMDMVIDILNKVKSGLG